MPENWVKMAGNLGILWCFVEREASGSALFSAKKWVRSEIGSFFPGRETGSAQGGGWKVRSAVKCSSSALIVTYAIQGFG